MLTNDLAYVIGFGCEAVLYGAYCIIFMIATAILLNRGGKQGLNWPLVLTNSLLFLCCTAHFALQFTHYYTYLAAYGFTGFSDETTRQFGADVMLSVTDFIGDAVLCYRCWIVWGRNHYIVILPMITATAGLACIAGLAHLSLTEAPTAPEPPAAIVPLGIAGYVLPLCTNIMVTLLIVGRVWFVTRDVRGAKIGSKATQKAMFVLVESGSLYLVIQLIYVVMFAMSHPAEDTVALIAVQIYGIAPTLIIIRAGLDLSDTSMDTNGLNATAISLSSRRERQQLGFELTSPPFTPTEVTVTNSWIVKSDEDMMDHRRGSQVDSKIVV